MKVRLLCLLGMVAVLDGCSRVNRTEARALVARYDQAIIEAYRLNDVRLADPVVLPDSVEGRRLTGLIGVRMDMGISLDASLVSLQVVGASQQDGQLLIQTRERWRYRDRRVGTGEAVGQPSEDAYDLEYRFQRRKGAWLVTETRFTTPPVVGRQAAPWHSEVQTLHGITIPETERSPNTP